LQSHRAGFFGALAALALSSSCAKAPSTSSHTWYVDVHGTPPGDGTQDHPFTSIQYAISRPTTIDGNTVLVAPGTYHEQIDFLGKTIRVIGTSGAANTVIVGQFPESPSVVIYKSVVNFTHSEGPDTLLDGFTITGGGGTGEVPGIQGGGIFCTTGSPTLVHLIVEGNQANYGGGMVVAGMNARVVECTIQDNAGGGVVAGYSVTLEACTIRRNHANGYEAGGYSGSGTLRNCLIAENIGYHGGGVLGGYFYNSTPTTLVGCTIRDNRTPGGTTPFYDSLAGGGVYGPATLTNCTITGNVASGEGAGAYNCTLTGCEIAHNTLIKASASLPALGAGAADCVLVNCSVHDNTAVFDPPDPPSLGGGISGGSATGCRIFNNVAGMGAGMHGGIIESCTVYGNTASVQGGAFTQGSSASLHNSILWADVPDEIDPTNFPPPISYCCIHDGPIGMGNIALDPLLWSPLTGDFHLKAGSPCIDAGDPADMDPDGSRIDIGAYPFEPDYCGPFGKYCSAKTNSHGCTPEISWSGSPNLSGPDDFLVTATQELNQRSGLLLWSTTRASNFVLGGILCVAAFKRTPAQDSGGSALPTIDCSGRYRYHFSHADMTAHELTVGTTVFAQYYARDPFHVDGTGASLSNALEFTICP
jgi:hypothetical protein